MNEHEIINGMKFVDEVPPARRNRKPRRSKWDGVVEVLRTSPGVWAVILPSIPRGRAGVIGRQLVTRYENVEYVTRGNGDDSVDLYARAVEEE